jgi:hypothetical protein
LYGNLNVPNTKIPEVHFNIFKIKLSQNNTAKILATEFNFLMDTI